MCRWYPRQISSHRLSPTVIRICLSLTWNSHSVYLKILREQCGAWLFKTRYLKLQSYRSFHLKRNLFRLPNKEVCQNSPNDWKTYFFLNTNWAFWISKRKGISFFPFFFHNFPFGQSALRMTQCAQVEFLVFLVGFPECRASKKYLATHSALREPLITKLMAVGRLQLLMDSTLLAWDCPQFHATWDLYIKEEQSSKSGIPPSW